MLSLVYLVIWTLTVAAISIGLYARSVSLARQTESSWLLARPRLRARAARYRAVAATLAMCVGLVLVARA